MSPRYGGGNRGWEVGRPAGVSGKGRSRDWAGAPAPARRPCRRRESPRRTHTGPRGWVRASLGTAGPGAPHVPRPESSFPLDDPAPGPALFCSGATPGWGSAPPSHAIAGVRCADGAPRRLCHGPQPPRTRLSPSSRFRFKPKPRSHSRPLAVRAGPLGASASPRSPEEVTPGPQRASSFTPLCWSLRVRNGPSPPSTCRGGETPTPGLAAG